MRAEKLITIAAVIAALLCGQTIWAQAGDDSFFIESFESVAPSANEGDGIVMPTTNQYEINLDLPTGVSLYRAFQRKQIEMGDAAFDTGIAEEAHTAATFSFGSRTQMSLTRDEKLITDVFDAMREKRTVTGMQLQQGFGGGASTGNLTLYRQLTSERDDEGIELETLVQSVKLQTGLGEGNSLVANFTEKESEEDPFRLQEEGYNAGLTMALSGGQGEVSYGFLERLVEGRSLQTRSFDIKAPFAIEGGTLLAEHHLQEKITDRNEEIQRKTHFDVPLDMLRSGMHASFVEETKIKNGNRNQKSVLDFVTPMNLFGHDATLQHTLTETVRGESFKEERVTRLVASFSTGKGILERTEIVQPRGDDLRHEERLRLQTPPITLTDFASLAANQVRTEVDGEETGRVSNLTLDLKPFRPLAVRANLRVSDAPGEESISHRDVSTRLTLAPDTSLAGMILERQRPNGSPTILRHLELVRKPGDLDVRFGYASYGVQETDEDTAMLAEVKLGGESSVTVDALYTEYDEKKKEPLAEPATTVELRAGDPSRLGMRAGFIEQGSRAEPERSVGLAMGAFGGSLVLDYVRNPLDPRGKHSMLSDVYQLGFKRQVFGGVNMDFGYRYFLPHGRDTETEHFFKLQLDGGSPEGGGQIALKYVSGHFVPYPRRGDPPASLLDVTYEKRWPGADGRLLLTLSRQEPPELSVGVDDNVEAEVKFETRF